jgi:GntR family transcriptional regulator
VQLRNRIAYLIRVGYFKPGEQIPSVRSLSTSAKINYTTVTKAYKDLEQSKLIISIRGRGMYVQKDVTTMDEGAESAVDIVIEDCVKQYRSVGMSYKDIRERMQDIAISIENKAKNAAVEKMEYYDV